jgi:hypothetical protein
LQTRNPKFETISNGQNSESSKQAVSDLDNELPRSKLMGYQNIAMRIYPKGVTPECFNRGSTMLTTTLSHAEWVGGSSSGLAWIPDKSIRE